MANKKETILERVELAVEAERPETLAAIDEGIRDANAGRTLTAHEVRKQMLLWSTGSRTRKCRRKTM
jgi:predicted transcriptional regulator